MTPRAPSATSIGTAAPSAALDPQLIDDLVSANHILYDHGVLDAYGHVSARDPRNPDRYWLSRSMAPALVTPEDLLEFDLASNPIDRQGRKIYLERFIHGEIYRARPDVTAVLHNHSPSLIPFCNSTVPLRPMMQTAGFLGAGAPVFDLRTVDDGPDMLIRTPAQAASLAGALGSHAIVLIRGHGAVVVGNSIRQVVWRGIHSETNAKQQLEAARLGPIQFLSLAEAEHAAKTVPNDAERAWQLWKHRIATRAAGAPR
jgi:ribulose-5-phosphate 4-epimerase/fuculose-1-phosphate aldolase